jgi:hypothetical protein
MVKRVMGPVTHGTGEVTRRMTYDTATAALLGTYENPETKSVSRLYETRSGQMFLHFYERELCSDRMINTLLPVTKRTLAAWCKPRGLDWHKRKPAPQDTTTTLYVRMPKALKARIDAEAKRLRRSLGRVSVNELVSKRLETAFDPERGPAIAYALAGALRVARGEDDGDVLELLGQVAELTTALDADDLERLANGEAVEYLGQPLRLKSARESRKDLN